jgi:phycocyanobilin:ferredoxin oxidoreductase
MTQNLVLDKTIELSHSLLRRLDVAGTLIPNNDSEFMDEASLPWKDYVYASNAFRRAHVNIVDARESRNIWMMHCCVFPHINDPSPIFGLDVIAGPSRISGAFHDFSKTVASNHYMMNWFTEQVSQLTWKKPRELPDWALEIFSPSIVAVGAVNTEAEILQLINLFEQNLDYYINNVGSSKDLGKDFTSEQNRYCHYQKKNPHNARFMQLLGLSEQEATNYVDYVMFPEI